MSQGKSSLQSALILARQVALEVVELMEGPSTGEKEDGGGEGQCQLCDGGCVCSVCAVCVMCCLCRVNYLYYNSIRRQSLLQCQAHYPILLGPLKYRSNLVL